MSNYHKTLALGGLRILAAMLPFMILGFISGWLLGQDWVAGGAALLATSSIANVLVAERVVGQVRDDIYDASEGPS